MGKSNFNFPRRAAALLSGAFVAFTGLTVPAQAADSTVDRPNIMWTIGESVPAELSPETKILGTGPINIREATQWGFKNEQGDRLAYVASDDWYETSFDFSQGNTLSTYSLAADPSKVGTSSDEFLLPYEAVQKGYMSREDMARALQAISYLSYVGPLKYIFTDSTVGTFDREREALSTGLVPPGAIDPVFTPANNNGRFTRVALGLAFAHAANSVVGMSRNDDGTYSWTTPDGQKQQISNNAYHMAYMGPRPNDQWTSDDLDSIYELYTQFVSDMEAHNTGSNMLDINLDASKTQISLNDDETAIDMTFVMPSDKVWDATYTPLSPSVLTRRASISYELYRKSADGSEELVATADPSNVTVVENGDTTVNMTMPIEPALDASAIHYVLKAKAEKSVASIVAPPANDNESLDFTSVAIPADLVSTQDLTINPRLMDTVVRPANNGVIDTDSASISVTDEITPRAFADGTYKFVGEVREVTKGVAGQPIATATTTATLADGAWSTGATVNQVFDSVPVEAGKRYVVFERAYREGDDANEYSEHQLVSDFDQSFLIMKRVIPTTPTSTESTTTTATESTSVTSTTTETTTNTVTSTSWVVEPTVETETSTVNETTTVVVPETETSTVTSTATAETTTVTTVPAGSDVATETVIVNETTVVTSTTDAPVTTMPAETTTNTVTDTATATTTVIVDNGNNDGSAAFSSKLPWWLVLIPVIPAVLGFIWNMVNHIPAPASAPGVAAAGVNGNGAPAPAPASQGCERVSFRGHNLAWGVLAGTISLIFGQNVTDHCVNN